MLDDHELDLVIAMSAAINAMVSALIKTNVIEDVDGLNMLAAAEEVLECAYICKRRAQTRVRASTE